MINPSRAFAAERFIVWLEKHGWRLDQMHPDVAAEVRSVVRDRLQLGEHSGLTDEDRRHCLMRVASRIRIKSGSIPAGEPGSGEQLRAVLAAMAEGGKREAA